MNSEETLANARTRGNMYGVLALSFYPPSADVGRIWHDLMHLLGELPEEDGTTGGDATTLSSVAFQGLEQEYNRLFVGPGHVVCPPYESVYAAGGRDGEAALVLGPPSLDVQTLYREAGLGVVRGFNDLPDHVAVELEFMKYLCDREVGSSERDVSLWRSRQAMFIREHLGQWIPAFSASVAKETTSPYYRAAAKVLKQFVEEEKDLATRAGERPD